MFHVTEGVPLERSVAAMLSELSSDDVSQVLAPFLLIDVSTQVLPLGLVLMLTFYVFYGKV